MMKIAFACKGLQRIQAQQWGFLIFIHHARRHENSTRNLENEQRGCKVLASTTRYNLDDFKTITSPKVTPRELGRGNRFAIVFHDNTARQQALHDQELFQCAGKLGLNGFSVRNQ